MLEVGSPSNLERLGDTSKEADKDGESSAFASCPVPETLMLGRQKGPFVTWYHLPLSQLLLYIPVEYFESDENSQVITLRRWKWLECSFGSVELTNLGSMKTGPGGVRAPLGLHSHPSEDPKLIPDGTKNSEWCLLVSSLFLLVRFLLPFLNDLICWKLYTNLTCLHIVINSELSQLYIHKDRVFVFTWFHVKKSKRKETNKNRDVATLLSIRFIIEHGSWRNTKIFSKW